MIYVGLDDTDTLEDPGTNQLARHIVRQVADDFHGEIIVRHQLLEDPRVPCTRKNGCASMTFTPRDGATIGDLIGQLRAIVIGWCPAGSDPGLCVTEHVSDEIVQFGRRCQQELIRQREALELAARHHVYLEGLGGTRDGVIGALAAVGLFTTGDDGRVVYLASSEQDLFEISGPQSIEAIRGHGIDEIRCCDSRELLGDGLVDVGKRLRPNRRQGKTVLYVAPADQAMSSEPSPARWHAVRLT